MINHVNRLIMSVIVLIPLYSHAMILNYSLLKSPEEKYVLLLGDAHHVEFDQGKTFEVFLDVVNKTPLNAPLPVVAELSEDAYDFLSPTFKRLCEFASKARGVHQLKLIRAEQRGAESSLLGSTMGAMAGLIRSAAPLQMLKEFYKLEIEMPPYEPTESWQDLAAQMKALQPKEDAISKKSYSAMCERQIEILKELARKYEDSPAINKLFLDGIATYTQALVEIKRYYASSDEESFEKALMSIFYSCETLQEVLKVYHSVEEVFCDTSDYLFADYCFFDAALEQLADQPCVCVITGGHHEESLRRLF